MSADTRSASFDAADTTTVAGPRGWLNAMFNASAGGARSDQSCQVELPEPVRLLAQGDAFSFDAHITYRWRGQAVSRAELSMVADHLLPRARRIVVHWLRPIARTYPPHRAQELEDEINKRFDDYWCRLTDGVQEARFTFSSRVEPDPVVQAQMRPYWEARIKAECDHELGLQQARQADELTRRWSEVFDRLQQDPRAAHAVALSEERFAAAFRAFVDNRDRDVKDLVTLLRDAVKGHNDSGLGPSEYTRAWDAALKAFQREHGFEPADAD